MHGPTQYTSGSVDLTTPLTYVKGVGPGRAAMLEAKGLVLVEDLLAYAPMRYEDRSNVKPIDKLAPGEMATVIADVEWSKVASLKRRNLGLFEAAFTDGSRERLRGKWFHGAYLEKVLTPGLKLALYGKIEIDSYTGALSVMHPEFEILSADDEDGESSLHTGRVVPIYEACGKITTRIFRAILRRILDTLPPVEDPLPQHIRCMSKLNDLWTALNQLHLPSEDADLRPLNAFRS